MEVTKVVEFDMAHRLFHHEGKCNHIHGHRYTVGVTVSGEVNHRGMVVDFAELKNILNEHIVESHDHAIAVNQEDCTMLSFLIENNFKFVLYETDPTAEAMAENFFKLLKRWFKKIESVTVWETPTSYATYKEKK